MQQLERWRGKENRLPDFLGSRHTRSIRVEDEERRRGGQIRDIDARWRHRNEGRAATILHRRHMLRGCFGMVGPIVVTASVRWLWDCRAATRRLRCRSCRGLALLGRYKTAPARRKRQDKATSETQRLSKQRSHILIVRQRAVGVKPFLRNRVYFTAMAWTECAGL